MTGALQTTAVLVDNNTNHFTSINATHLANFSITSWTHTIRTITMTTFATSIAIIATTMFMTYRHRMVQSLCTVGKWLYPIRCAVTLQRLLPVFGTRTTSLFVSRFYGCPLLFIMSLGPRLTLSRVLTCIHRQKTDR